VILIPWLALLVAQANPDLESLKTAQQLMDGGRWAEAIPVLKELVGKHPEAPTLTYGLGRCYFEVEDYGAAVTSLREAAQRIPNSAEVRFFLGSALGLGGNFGEAIRELRAAIDLDPQFEPAYRAFGMFRVERAQYLPDALAALETAVRLDPQDARALYWLGEFHRGLGELTKARTDFERAHRLDPDGPLTQLGLGQVSLEDGEADEALVHFDAVLKQAPGLVAALLGRARALYDKGQFGQALAPAKAAWEDSHEFEERRSSGWILVRIYRALGRDAEAQASEGQLKDLETTSAGELLRLRELGDEAARYEAEGRFDRVAELLEASLKIRERHDALTRLGDAYLKLGRLGDAERCYVRASEIGPLTDALKQRLKQVRDLSAQHKP
jgi:tetratricopeptide (TPR) repeat protein